MKLKKYLNGAIKMKKAKRTLVALLITANAITSYFTYLYFNTKPVKIAGKTKIIYKSIDRDYDKLTKTNCIKELKRYGTDIPRLDGHIEQPNIFYAEAGLYDRTWSRKFKLKVKVNESSNWRYYVGFGVLGTIAGGTIIYKIMK